MKKFYLLCCLFLATSSILFGQAVLKNVYIASGGSFSNPDDFVVIRKVDPETYSFASIDTIYTQAVNDLLIYGDRMFVAAMDSLVAYDLNTGDRYAAIDASNANKLSMVNDHLWLSRQGGVSGPPADGIFLKVFNPLDLSLVKDVEGIADDAVFVSHYADSVYVTVPGNWAATEGRLAVLDLATYTVQRIVNLGAEAVGIFNIHPIGNRFWITCKTPYMGTTGVFVDFDPVNAEYDLYTYDSVFSFGAGTDPDHGQSVLVCNNEIMTYRFADGIFTALAPDPGSTNWITWSSAAWERGSMSVWGCYTDYYSFGTCAVYNSFGIQQASFDVGIAPEALAFHYENASLTDEVLPDLLTNSFPNPCSGYLVVESSTPCVARLMNAYGALVRTFQVNQSTRIITDVLSPGLYFLQMTGNGQKSMTKIIIK
ncbi:MAG: T9SS type A sorting domain-containing protein [Bacteroidales bacterium]|nr:T9SS type A sorting domain-containing protein [Bacteroidales bacterium]MDD2322201.1 T9SS type A sorting domain-containing protein [Bacteroidales bacterium]MDD3010630.1 T9SS type A sorting domain-containing protein [Bacteroidales bacterium]MDD3960909.1 T9SS type A sorting domain-containing protein [Bacteroidales bacterium]MDY0285271.1 T9SS type A sorting domain-containing protein [Bacteroidales bacterium]